MACETIDFRIPLMGECDAVIRLPRHMTEEEFDLLRQLLLGWLDGCRDALVTPAEDCARVE